MRDYNKLLDLLNDCDFKILWPTKIIILDCSINESIYRRKKFQNNPEFKNWFDFNFLNNLKDFYINELPKIIKCPIVSIDTTNNTIAEVDNIIKRNL